MTFAIHTFGCKVNIYESEFIINKMEENGYTLVDFNEKADIYIINTCTVTNEADKKDRKLINSVRKNHKDSILIVMGCYSQLNPQNIDADIVLGNKHKSKIIELIDEYKTKKEKIILVEDLSETNFEDMYINRFVTHTRAFVKIQDGCNAFCSYCTIPYARGSLRSKNFNTVIEEVTNLVNNGYKEIVLTGIHTGRYGIEQNTNLEKLLKELVKIKDIFRIRLSSIEINEITDGIIDLIKNNDIMAKHLHIPLQSGSNTILKNMNRLYDLEFYLKRINYIRKEIPAISITTDLIVGFPGETEDLFKETIDTLNKIKFTKIHTFPYSKRNGTKAASMPNHLDGQIKKCRVKEVLNLSDKYELEYYQKNIDKEFDGIVETRKDNKKIVITSNYIPVEVDTNLDNNVKVNIKITEIEDNKIIGKITDR
ncbi:MAG: tRNA (N(6)-L-threonylcarbamoyladenosine(37)-C(2))-methylthiotransferase MtaB [Bacilli bacterium]|nr:tRNA (N(6)-L-threonylcarbamoyladenosine(37)-C(2))-methylthiotransferase MtaB [Bacilli bacterium]